MKKIISIILMFLTTSVFATTMCALEDTVAIVLDPAVAPTTYSQNQATMTWTATFPYGVVRGIAACLPVGGSGIGAISTNTTVTSATGGEKLGNYCWCKLTHPVSSLWAFSRSNSYCASGCTNICGGNVRSIADLRGGLFGSVAQ